ncbi:MAG TPA: hypothetical protein VLT82_04845 [Myxococcaceae bacterium]|nr:hypothetical protein [Myxococcaceae bacterium]
MARLPGGQHRPPLFQTREPPRRFLGPFLLVIALHAGVIAWTARIPPTQVKPAAEPVKVVLRLPPLKVAVKEPPGGGPKRPPPPARHPQARRHLRTPKVIPPPVVETPPPPLPEPPKVAEAEEAGEEDDGDGDPDAAPGLGGGGGIGTGIGPGVGPGQGGVRSKARKAWLSHTDWRCLRPGNEDLGRVVVRIRVEVLADGKPGQVRVVRPGPEDFNRRAVDCARDETYLPALDPDGRPIPGDCEFSIEFLN